MPNPAPKKPRLKRAASILIHAPDYAFETEHGAPAKIVCGIDEAGRGPLAGPVVAAAAIIDIGNCPKGLNDSKKLTQKAREKLFEDIVKRKS